MTPDFAQAFASPTVSTRAETLEAPLTASFWKMDP